MLIVNSFLDQNTCNQLNDWVELGVKNGWLGEALDVNTMSWDSKTRRTTRNYADRFEYPAVVYQISEKITETLKLQGLAKSVIGGGKNGIVVNYVLPDGDVYEHMDPKEGDLEVLRCNIITKEADAGGDLIVDGQKIDVGIGDLHCYLASAVNHLVTKVEGQTPRILWMFGYQCSVDRFNELSQ